MQRGATDGYRGCRESGHIVMGLSPRATHPGFLLKLGGQLIDELLSLSHLIGGAGQRLGDAGGQLSLKLRQQLARSNPSEVAICVVRVLPKFDALIDAGLAQAVAS